MQTLLCKNGKKLPFSGKTNEQSFQLNINVIIGKVHKKILHFRNPEKVHCKTVKKLTSFFPYSFSDGIYRQLQLHLNAFFIADNSTKLLSIVFKSTTNSLLWILKSLRT